jgi:uncharacterized protein (TIGR03083 family)
MILSPRYEGPVVLTMSGPVDDQLLPVTRQRRRLGEILAGLTPDQWRSPSRCAEWTVQDVVVHLNGVNPFWQMSIDAGLAGAPSRFLATFDPAATPALMVGGAGEMEPAAVLDRFLATNEALLAVLASLDQPQWSTPAEAPPGHVPIRLLAQHALWDCWVHERDIVVPLGEVTVVEPDEVRSCLRYAAAVSPALAMGLHGTVTGSFAVEATGPDVAFVVHVGDSVVLDDDGDRTGLPCLRGSALDLVEALSLRAPLPDDSPDEWRQLLGGLGTAFDADLGG